MAGLFFCKPTAKCTNSRIKRNPENGITQNLFDFTP